MNNKTKSNFTDLASTYLYGKDSWRNFTKKYYNNDQSIDDPIFTGFSMSIDDLTSPLFFTDGMDTGETLRSAGGSNTDLASQIEARLKKVNEVYIKGNPGDYEINTKSVKDVMDAGESFRAGYGLQDRVYMDNVLYGAMEYIYMVDKVADGNVVDSLGVSDLGNGTPNKSVYDEYNDIRDEYNTEMANQMMEDISIEMGIIPEGEGTYENTIDSNKDAFTRKQESNEVKNAHDANQKAVDVAKNNYISVLEHMKGEKDIQITDENGNVNLEFFDALKKEYDDMCNREHIQYGKEKFSELKRKVLAKYNELKDAIEAQAEEKYKNLKIALDQACDEFENTFGNKDISTVQGAWDVAKGAAKMAFDAISDANEKTKDESNEIAGGIQDNMNDAIAGTKKIIMKFTQRKGKCEEEDDLPKMSQNYEECKETCERTYNILKKQIVEVINDPTYDDIIKAKKRELDQIAAQLYGVDANGDPLTKEESIEKGTGAYGAYIAAVDELENDEFNQLEKKKELLTEANINIANTMEYNEYEGTKQQTVFSPPRTIAVDNDGNPIMDEQGNPMMTISRLERSRGVMEVPQTVYDIIGFINGMKKLTTEYPYVMQAITGLDEAYRNYFYNKNDAYLGSGDNKISITCYESLDLRVSSMFNKYFNAVYDRQYRRERVPINLRRFNCSIFVHDIRNFRNSISKNEKFYEGQDGDNVFSKIVEVALNCMSVVEFKFFDCEIVPEETGNIFGNVNNEGGNDMLKTNFSFTYGNCVINFLPFGDLERYYTPQVPAPVVAPEKKGYFRQLFGRDNGAEELPQSGDFRRWFDKSELGNVNNNDYRDYIRHDSSVAVDDYYKNTISNNFANNSIGMKNQELTNLDDALRRMVIGVSASTGIPAKGVSDALNIKYIDPIINNPPIGVPVKGLGNIHNEDEARPKDTKNLGKNKNETPQPHNVSDLGNVNK